MGIVLLLAGLWLIKWFSGWLRKRSGRMSTLLLRRLSSLVIIALRVLLILTVMQIIRIQLTFLAVLILLLKRFEVGDNILAQNQEGTVTSIQIFYTIVKMFDTSGNKKEK